MIWFTLLIPLIAVPITRFWWPHRIVWWEMIIPLVPALIIVPMVWAGGRYWATADKERWGNYAVECKHFEDWNERVPCRHPKTRTEYYTDSNGNSRSREVPDGTMHPYDVDYHPEYWVAIDNADATHNITKTKFLQLVRDWGNRRFKDLHRNYHTNDGDMYFTRYNGDPEMMSFLFSQHIYENRVQINRGVFSFDTIDNPEELGLFEWPKLRNKYYDPAVLGPAVLDTLVIDEKRKLGEQFRKAGWTLQKFNAEFGFRYQIRVWILLFENAPRQRGFQQESYWDGGNKNEFVITIGTDDGVVQWCHPFCWSPDGYAGNDTLRIRVRDFVEGQNLLDLQAVVDFSIMEIPGLWKRKPFEELKFLDIPTPMWLVVISFFLMIGSTAGCVWFSVVNDVTESTHPSFSGIKAWWERNIIRRWFKSADR